MRILLSVTLLTTFLFVSTAEGQGGRTKRAIRKVMKEYAAVGLSVAVVKNSAIVYEHAFGLKDRQSREKLETTDLFRIASISKSFSATSIMQLVEAGKLSLDDDFSNLVGFTVRNPKFPGDVITLRMVLSHTSSINDSQGYFSLDSINPAKTANWQNCYSDYAPGKGYRYCNLNYNLVGAVIEKFGGERFDQYVRHHVLEPLQLYGGYCVDSLDASRLATLYEYDSATASFSPQPGAYNPRRTELQQYQLGYSTPVFSPTGGMKISAPGLARYMMMHLNYGAYAGGQLISTESSKIMQTPLSAEENYGLALWKTDKFIPGEQLVGHTGSAYGLYSVMFFEPQQKFGVVLITNGCNPVYKEGFNDLLRKCAGILYHHYIKP
ncbi:serine hydrolase domain-containing protein [Flavihumibacter petaseus]|uniref:Peptidase S12 family protein n=1 Tax=Flavihumibacter petaseus NBRC 106054 TaxID=1220578 RepID=A0A0E9N464_9BACT|nr:serine hydrolase domain-containing protein [Flavihumibacter petaseus]GAO44446.1 peptidase S12 family protein [Flavihumibacter petaseus NBRC 106054]